MTCRYPRKTEMDTSRTGPSEDGFPPFVSQIEDHWYGCRYCRDVGMFPDAKPLVLHAKTCGDQRARAWARKIEAGP